MRHIVMVVGLLACSAIAQDAGTKFPIQMSPEQRSKMADAHEKMAACLRSTRPLAECHDEMMKTCQQTLGHNMCPMMGKGLAHGGPRGGKPPPGNQ